MAFPRRTQKGLNWYARYKRGDGTWVDELAKGEGYPNTKAGAEKLERQRAREVSEGTFTGSRSLDEWLDEWTKRRTTREKLSEASAVRRHMLGRVWEPQASSPTRSSTRRKWPTPGDTPLRNPSP
jgi:hypothetical protein